jgi:UDP-N-acetylglucosamine 2-epimerase (non-hydrolysing)
MSMEILHVVGTRPNFVKLAPVQSALKRLSRIKQVVVHTGQHYDLNMSRSFFHQLDIPEPDMNLGVGSGSHSDQTAKVMTRLEPMITGHRPDVVLVYGDVNSTLAAALVCAKLVVPVGHVEAGLRSRDRTMPEEVNRVLTDRLAELLFTPSEDADNNLRAEGVPPETVHLVGNVMIDTIVRHLPCCRDPRADGLPANYALVTLHRPSNVDDPNMLHAIIEALADISRWIPVIFPVHPRTRNLMGAWGRGAGIHFLEPLGYLEFIALEKHATVVITDSGGVQEETTYLGVPCLTLRENTERPVTVTMGTNVLIGRNLDRLRTEVDNILQGRAKIGRVPPLWDGHAGERIAVILESWRTQHG